MTGEQISDALNELDDKMIEHTGLVREQCRRRKRRNLLRLCRAAACFCLVCLIGIAVSPMLRMGRSGNDGSGSGAYDSSSPMSGAVEENAASDEAMPETAEEEGVSSAQTTDSGQSESLPEPFVPISSLLADGIFTDELVLAAIPIETYSGIYEKIPSAKSEALPESIGAMVPGAEEWYYVSGHTDLQYLIQNDGEAYSLWKFQSFDSEAYPYRDVLELVYRIDSADQITEITVMPPTFDNTNNGKQIQAELGTHTITERDAIERLYEILSGLVCYGSNHWDLIDYGATDAAADTGLASDDAIRLGRYLSILTDYGNEIDGLKYTAVSDMFYEYSGIAYEPLSEEQADTVRGILGIASKNF